MGAPRGNRNACKAKIWEQALKRALARASNETVEKGLDLLADQVVKAALAREQWAVLEIGNRMDGKATEHIQGDYTHRLTSELSDEELTAIATGSSAGTAEAPSGETEPSGLH